MRKDCIVTHALSLCWAKIGLSVQFNEVTPQDDINGLPLWNFAIVTFWTHWNWILDAYSHTIKHSNLDFPLKCTSPGQECTTSEDKTEGTDLPKEEEEGWGWGINKSSKFVKKKGRYWRVKARRVQAWSMNRIRCLTCLSKISFLENF